jgi:hypothetical protein
MAAEAKDPKAAAEAKAPKASGDPQESSQKAPEEAPEEPELPPKPASAKSLAHLYELMVRETPLTDSDLAAYQKYAGDIVAMGANPELLANIVSASGWTESRLTYVAVKVGLGLARLEDPNSPVLAHVPEFAWPTEEEALLIEFKRDALAKALRTAEPAIAPEPIAEPEAE